MQRVERTIALTVCLFYYRAMDALPARQLQIRSLGVTFFKVVPCLLKSATSRWELYVPLSLFHRRLLAALFVAQTFVGYLIVLYHVIIKNPVPTSQNSVRSRADRVGTALIGEQRPRGSGRQ